ncbi:MAG: hypothetical protein P1V20_04385 [Verrucomicrobiales bacterium]|nr:hypothetical protein [Verrucomicrobiales bacterium]
MQGCTLLGHSVHLLFVHFTQIYLNPTSSELTFQPTPLTVVFGIGIVLAALVLGFFTWKRSGYSRNYGILELLRVLIVGLVALAINQPEWREVFEPEEKPVLAILRDQSNSMDTADVLDLQNPSNPPSQRKEIAAAIAKPEGWERLNGKMRLIFEGFTSGASPAASATDLDQALDNVLDQNPGLRGVVLLSDGDWNMGEPPARAATRLRMRGTPVFALPIGSDTKLPDIEMTAFDVPTFAIVGKPVRLPFSINSSLPIDYTAVVEATTDSGEKLSKEVTVPAMGRIQDSFSWKPVATGDVNVTVSIPVTTTERDDANNELTAPISIRKESLRVLIIESFPRWEYRYLRNALERDPGVEVNCLLYHPDMKAMGAGSGYLDEFPEPELLTKFDVIFLGDVGVENRQLTLDQCKALRDHVANQAGGLVFLPGFRGNQHDLLSTPLAELLPVVLDEAQPRGWGSPTPGQFELTDLGLRSLLTRLEDTDGENADIWASLPGFQWFAGVSRAKSGTEVLATHSSETNRYGRIPLIVTKTFGTGKILFMGTDGAWRWRKGVEDKYHYRFWGQVARWMAYQRNMSQGETMRLFYSPDRPQTGDILTMNANVMSVGGEPLRNANVVVQIKTPSGKIESIRFQTGGADQWGLFTATYSPTEPGEYQVTMTCAENGGTLETGFTVQGNLRERVGQPARKDVMEEIARITRGALIEKPDIAQILDKIEKLPEPSPMERRLRIWSHPAWIGLLIVLLTAFWIGRKAVGAV